MCSYKTVVVKMSELEISFLPWSSRRYKISVTGKIFTIDDNEIVQVKVDNAMMVSLEWVEGNKLYPVGLLVLVTFKKLTLEEHLLKEVEILHIDDDCENNTLINLLYRFKNGPLETEDYPGYYYIPLYTDYAINENQDLINIKTGKKKTWSIVPPGRKNSKGGYHYTRVLTDDGFSKVLLLHRAVCMVFHRYDSKMNAMVVNHIDGEPSNNQKDNLEWSTYKENNQHAYDNGLRPNSSLPVLVKNLDSGIETEYPSYSECARCLGLSGSSVVTFRIRKGWDKIYPDKLIFKLKTDPRPWPDIDLNEIEISYDGRPVMMVARNIFTGKVIFFSGAEQGSLLTGVKKQTILNHIKRKIRIPINGFNFRYLEKNINWPKHSKRHLLIYEKFPIYPPNGAIVWNVKNNEEKFYTSTSEAMKELKVNKSAFYYHAKNNKLIKNIYKVEIFDINTFNGPDSE